MSAAELPPTLMPLLELVGTAVFALSGALAAHGPSPLQSSGS